MLRGTAPRSVLIVGVLALLSSLVLGSRLLSSTPEPEGLADDVLQVETKLKPSPGAHTSAAGASPYQPPVQARQSSSEEPHEAPGHSPSPAAESTASQRSAAWDSSDEDSRGDQDQENDDD